MNDITTEQRDMASEMLDRFFEHLSNVDSSEDRQERIQCAIFLLNEELAQEKGTDILSEELTELRDKLKAQFDEQTAYTDFEDSVRWWWSYRVAGLMIQASRRKDWAELLYDGSTYKDASLNEILEEIQDALDYDEDTDLVQEYWELITDN